MKLNLHLFFVIFFFVVGMYNLAYSQNQMDDQSFGIYADRMLVTHQTMVLDDALVAAVTEIGNKVARVCDCPTLNFTFRIVNDPVVNAYSTPGGFIYITTGLLDVIESQDELAAVIAHELVHVCNDHLIKLVRQAKRKYRTGEASRIMGVTLLSLAGLDELIIAMEPGFQGGEMSRQSLLSKSMIQGYGEKLELEADSIAIFYLQKCGLDPKELVRVLEKLMIIGNSSGLNYRSGMINAKPGLKTRITAAQQMVNNLN